jgi:2-polyprenyl-6-methoxyphenol hydroxylase-like FAD-dependent oxidoreductase
VRIDDLQAVGDNELSTDVCIVGSGPAGLTLAAELAGTPLRVLVLESGGLESSEEVDALATTAPTDSACHWPGSTGR